MISLDNDRVILKGNVHFLSDPNLQSEIKELLWAYGAYNVTFCYIESKIEYKICTDPEGYSELPDGNKILYSKLNEMVKVALIKIYERNKGEYNEKTR